MAEENEMQVILVKAKTYTDGKYKFKQGIPVTMPAHIAKRYEKNFYFNTRTLKQASAFAKLQGKPAINPSSLDNAPISEADAKIPKKRTAKKVAKKIVKKNNGE